MGVKKGIIGERIGNTKKKGEAQLWILDIFPAEILAEER